MSSKRKQASLSPRVLNRRARRDYQIGEKLECGIVLRGTEVKAIRAGRVDLSQAFARVDGRRMELWLHELDIGAYDHASPDHQHGARTPRKLLARRDQIRRLYGKTTEKGTSLIPLSLYFNDRGLIKIELAVATGKRKSDKRETIKRKDAQRSIRQAMARRKIGG